MRSRPEVRSQRSEVRGERSDVRGPAGFTLVEMLVAIMIILIVAAMTLALVNVSMESDRLRSSARQVQSYLEGARDRAIFAGAPRGVRFLLDETGIVNGAGHPVTVSSMVFIGEAGGETERGTLRISHLGEDDTQTPSQPAFLVEQVRFWDTTTNPNQLNTVGTPWATLVQRGVLAPGTRIRLINGSNEIWLGIDSRSFLPSALFSGQTPANNGYLYLSRPHPDYAPGTRDGYVLNTTPPAGNPPDPNNQLYVGDAEHDLEYELQLGGRVVLANQEPMLLAQGIVIDLEPIRRQGKLPDAWYNPNAQQYEHIDVMFSPRGTVTGQGAAFGVIHFLLTDVEDVERRSGYVVGNPGINFPGPAPEVDGFIARDVDGSGQIDEGEQVTGDKLLVTVFTRTGHISTHPVDATDVRNNGTGAAGFDGFADDPLFFAEKGDVAR